MFSVCEGISPRVPHSLWCFGGGFPLVLLLLQLLLLNLLYHSLSWPRHDGAKVGSRRGDLPVIIGGEERRRKRQRIRRLRRLRRRSWRILEKNFRIQPDGLKVHLLLFLSFIHGSSRSSSPGREEKNARSWPLNDQWRHWWWWSFLFLLLMVLL